MFNFLKKKNVEEIDPGKSFQEFINKDLVPMFLMMAIVDKADDIGIESWELRKVLEKDRQKHSDETNKQIAQLMKKIDNTIEDEKFKNSLKAKIIFIVDCGKFSLNENFLEGTYTNNDMHYTFKMELNATGASFATTHNSLERTGKYTITKDNVVIEYGKKEKRIYDIDTDFSNNIEEEKVTRLLDKDGYELFNRTVKKRDNYKENKNDHQIVLNEPDVMENYTETEYKWRTFDNHILTRTIKKYLYPDGTKAFIDLKNTDYCSLRSDKIDNETKELPFGGHYYGFDKELFFAYKQGTVDIEAIKENVYSKHYSMPHIDYI